MILSRTICKDSLPLHSHYTPTTLPSHHTMSYTIPDLRFEQSFMRQLNTYAGNKDLDNKHSLFNKKNNNPLPKLTDGELQLLNENLDKEEEEYLEDPKPLQPITPRVVIFAIIKDQIVLPLLQGFFLTGFLMSVRPLLALLVRNGQQAGHWVSNLVGLNRLTPTTRRYVSGI